MKLLNDLQNLIKRAIVAGVYDESREGISVQQIEYDGKIVDAETLFQYGSFANLPTDGTILGVVFAVGNDDDDLSVICYNPLSRPESVAEGEVVYFHPITGSKVHFKNNGDIDITTDVDGEEGSANITVKKDLNVIVKGDANISVTGNTTLETAQLDVNSPLTNLGEGGPEIARKGDAVEVTVSSGSSAGTWSGTITGGGTNTSI